MLVITYIDNILPVDTNIIIFNLNEKISLETFVRKLAEHNIKANGFGKQTIRFVTHLDFTDDMMEKVEKILKNL